MDSRREEQLRRETALRQAALGRRAQKIAEGDMGPVLRRWVNADIGPIAQELREVAQLYLDGDMAEVASRLGTPTAAITQRERPLRPLMEWMLRGSSPGRGEDTTFAEDIVLSFMGTVLPYLVVHEHSAAPLSSTLPLVAEALRDTVHGQFITSIQGAEAMQKIRERHPKRWQQRRSLRRISAQLNSQVKPQLLAEERGEDTKVETRGHRKVLHVTDHNGELRRLELKEAPDATAWEVMALCWYDAEKDGGDHPHRNLWLAFAAMLLSIAQQTGGWFEISAKFRTASKSRRKFKTQMISLSPRAIEAIEKDVEKWVGNAFIAEPMLVPPEDGDFLTVKHRKVTGQRPPKGMWTRPEGTDAWAAACLIAASPWEVNELSPALGLSVEGDPWLAVKLASHRRLAGETFYLPVNMDFRGRIYYRTPWVTPQSDDLGKSLLRFPSSPHTMLTPKRIDALARHLDNAGPLTREAHERLMAAGRWDEIPVQLDGSCNGLQHLSALVMDEVGADAVNLTAGGSNPQDVYQRVANSVLDRLDMDGPLWKEAWNTRFLSANLVISRTLCKGPVMVLPYGGTLDAIRLSVKASVLAQLDPEGEGIFDSPWHRVEEDGYGAFRDRNLEDHPLFNADIRQLSALIHSCVAPAIPKAMATMDTLQAVGKWVGDRAIAWRAGEDAEGGMWVVQAKSKSARRQLTMRGFHLPDVIRRLTLSTRTNEVDPRAHRTGIVANLIHSLDAEHLARTVRRFRDYGGTCVGVIHDCVMVRPSDVALMHRCLRETFAEMYAADPLNRPVRIIPLDGGEVTEYESWHALAAEAGVSFPEPGSWEPTEVLDSQWFFS